MAIALEKNNMYAEENSGVYRRCSESATLGMNDNLIKAMKNHNVKIITVSDAHQPCDVGDKISIMEKKLKSI